MKEDLELLNYLREKDRKMKQKEELKKTILSILSIVLFPIIFLGTVIYFLGKKHK